MEVIMSSRRTGKTTQLIRKVIESNGVLLVSSELDKNRIISQYPEMKDKIHTVTVNIKVNNSRWYHRNVWIDDIDRVINIDGGNLVGLSITGKNDWDE